MKSIIVIAVLTLAGSVLSAAPIHDAAENGDLVEVRRLLDNDPTLLNAAKPGGRLPIHEAALRGRTDVV